MLDELVIFSYKNPRVIFYARVAGFFVPEVSMAANATEPRPTGRPSVRTKAMEKEILDRLEEGESLLAICRDEHLPNRSTWHDWIEKDPDLFRQYTRARSIQADVLLDDIADIEDRTLTGAIDPVAARTVLSSKQWRAMKMSPKQYGDRLATTLTGADDGPVKVEYDTSADARQALAEITARLAGLHGSH